ncbi:MAG: hypothetical protein ACXVJD_05470 [Mucilaginibacter sp.]
MAPKPNSFERLEHLHTRAGWLVVIQLIIVAAVGTVGSLRKFNQHIDWIFIFAGLSFLVSIIVSLRLRRMVVSAKEHLQAAKKRRDEGFAPLAVFAFTNLGIVQITSFLVGLLGLGAGTTLHLLTPNNKYMADPAYVVYLKNNSNSVEDRTRSAIAVMYGYDYRNIDVSPLGKDMADFSFSQSNILDLTGLLNVIVKASPNWDHVSKVSSSSVTAATKVKDCADLVKKAINP